MKTEEFLHVEAHAFEAEGGASDCCHILGLT